MNHLSNQKRIRPTVYDSAVDTWIVAMLLMTPMIAAGIGIYLMLIGQPGDAMILFLAGVGTLFVTALFTLPCRYTMLDDALSVRCGIICFQVPFQDIKKIEPSRTWRSGPALSMTRVLITTDKRYVIISPQERDDFIVDLSDSVTHSQQT